MTTATLTKVQPYVFFYGRCEEALEFYKSVFGGTWEGMRVSDTPMAKDMPPEAQNKIMHASFSAPGFSFLVSDGMQTKTIDPEEGNVALALTAGDAAEGARLHKALAEGGKVDMEFGDAFWGGKFGQVTDRFGNQWLITAQ
ncbi:MAG: VOC family protein [Candidatus Eremiobacteraeota bacterium]|nr:VOC family protein [Candidatus Eremiobacteraeota bacterium]